MIRPFCVLVLCTGNSARSILAEALFNHRGGGRVRAFSAGSRPSGQVHPLALATLAGHEVPLIAPPHSKSWDEFVAPGAPPVDCVITVCASAASAASEACPVWPGRPATVHWAIPDPAHVEPAAARQAAFEAAYRQLARRIEAFLVLPLEMLSPAEIRTAAQRIHDAAR